MTDQNRIVVIGGHGKVAPGAACLAAVRRMPSSPPKFHKEYANG